MPNDKLDIQLIGVGEHPTLIVGQNPGHNRDGTHTGKVWEKNRSARLLHESLDGRENIILTNICNYTEINQDRLIEGYNDISNLVYRYKPTRIICLGTYAYDHITAMCTARLIKPHGFSIAIYKLNHPSYIARFNKDKDEWINKVREILDEQALYNRGSGWNWKVDSSY